MALREVKRRDFSAFFRSLKKGAFVAIAEMCVRKKNISKDFSSVELERKKFLYFDEFFVYLESFFMEV